MTRWTCAFCGEHRNGGRSQTCRTCGRDEATRPMTAQEHDMFTDPTRQEHP